MLQSSSTTQAGSSATDRVKSARAALEKTARGLKERSQSTSPASTTSLASETVVPAEILVLDVLNIYRHEAKFFAPKITKGHQAKRLFGDWLAEVEGRILAVRAERDGTGRALTRAAARKLAGDWYDWFQSHSRPTSCALNFNARLRCIDRAQAKTSCLRLLDCGGLGVAQQPSPYVEGVPGFRSLEVAFDQANVSW